MIKKLFLVALMLLSVYKAKAQDNAPPTLSNFRIENSNKNRVYFDSSESITGSTYSGFIISGKTISGITINSGSTNGHYFSVSAAFTFWDNNTIRYEGGSDLQNSSSIKLRNFTLEYIINNIPEADSSSITYYINLNGDDNNSGLSEQLAWKTLNKAMQTVGPGDMVYIKAGNYNYETIKLKKSGTLNNPIKIIGYKTTPGDINSMYYSYSKGQTLDSKEMPLFDGNNRDNNIFVELGNKSYYMFSNLQITNYKIGFKSKSMTGFVGNNIVMKDLGSLTNHSSYGMAFSLESNKNSANKVRIINSVVVNATMDAYFLAGQGNLIDNCKAYCNEAPAGKGDVIATTDYYFSIHGSNNIIRNSLAYKDTYKGNGHLGHGFSIKAVSGPAEHNLIEKNVAIGIFGSFQARWSQSKYNVFKDCEAHANIPNRRSSDSGSSGIQIFTGADQNIFERIYVHDTDSGISFIDNGEESSHTMGTNNIIRNSIFNNVKTVLRAGNSNTSLTQPTGNKVLNCTFNNSNYLFNINKSGGSVFFINNEFKNNIFHNIRKLNGPNSVVPMGWSYVNNNFYAGFNMPQGIGNISHDPKFINESAGNFRLNPDSPLIDAGINLDNLNSDFEQKMRPQGSSTDIGAYEKEGERIGQINGGQDLEICFGENILLTAAGEGTFLWNTGETTTSIIVEPIITTTYSVDVVFEGNTYSDEVTVTVNQVSSVDAGPDVVICMGEEVILTATGIGNFLWSTGETTESITVSPNSTTTYSVTASNSCATDAMDEVIVTVNATPTLAINNTITSICIGESLDLKVTSNGNLSWSTGETTESITVNPIETTTYTITSTIGDCSVTEEIQVTVNQASSIDAGPDVVICMGEEVILTATGIGNFLWSTGETTESITVSPNSTTTYSVTASNSCATDAMDEVIVTVNATPTLAINNTITSICIGESLDLKVTSNGNLSWSTGETTESITVNPIETTTYTITSTIGDCSVTEEIQVTVNQASSIDAGPDVVICMGEEVILTATGIGNFLWSTGETTESITVSPNSTTTYSVTASNSCATDAMDEVIVTVNATPTLAINNTITSICIGESLDLKVTSNGNLSWSTGETTESITVNPIETTTYTITSTIGDCSVTEEIQVTVNQASSIDAGPDVVICMGEEVILTATGIGNFLWSTGETTESITVSPNSTTTYSVTASNSCATDAMDEVIVTVNPIPVLIVSDDMTIHSNENITLEAIGEGDFLWSTGETTSSITVSPLNTTIYSITLTSENGCSIYENVTVSIDNSQPISVVADAGPDVEICLNSSTILTASGGGSYLWDTGEITSSITVNPTETTTYYVTVSDGINIDVNDVDEVTVYVNQGCSGISNRLITKEIKVYPNPTQGVLNIELTGFSDELNISLISLRGRLIYSENLYNSSLGKVLKRQINLSRFGKGVYYVRLDNNGESETKKVLVI